MKFLQEAMFTFAVWMLLVLTVPYSKQACFSTKHLTSYYSLFYFNCNNTNPEDFLYDLLSDNAGIYAPAANVIVDLKISDSNFAKIHSFDPFIAERSFKLRRLALTNSSVRFVEDGAFASLSSMTNLVLSHNKLKNLSFVRTLPSYLKGLYLDNNEFEVVSNVFTGLSELIYLDLSNCRISNIEADSFSNFYNKMFINLGSNRLTLFDLSFEDGLELQLDLSYNNIKYIKGTEKRVYLRELRASHNQIQGLGDISCQDCGSDYYGRTVENIDLSYNDLRNVTELNLFSATRIKNLNLSNTNINKNFSYEILKFVTDTVDLSNNNLGIMKPSMLGSKLKIFNLFLYNCSVSNIEKWAFKSYDLNTLDISFNLISELGDLIFEGSSIDTINISHCRLEKIHSKAFFGLILTNSLNLSFNKLTHLSKDVFEYLSDVQKIDLSFNSLKQLDNNLFVGCLRLKILNLSDSKIEIVRSLAFAGTGSLTQLRLENNLIDNIWFEVSDVPHMINLKNNSMSNINFSFLKNLSASVVDLSNSNLGTLMNTSIQFTAIVREMNLSRSHIYRIDGGAFRGLRSLQILDLSGNLLEEILLGTFTPLKNLEILHLLGNRIVSFSSSAFAFGNRLRFLSISFFKTSCLGNTFATLNQLQSLRISNSSVVLLNENCFKGLIYLENMILSETEVEAVTPGAFKGLNSLRNVDFKVFYQKLNKVEAGAFETLPSLLELDLSHLNLKELESRAFVGLSGLKELRLDNNHLRTIVNNTFSGLDYVKVLNLSNNLLTSLEPRAFTGLTNLEELFLNNNNLTKLALGTFQQFPSLKKLVLQNNYINKLLTGTFSNLKSLNYLDLSYNNITKLKMENFVSLTNLETLDITHNHVLQMGHLELIRSLRHLRFVGLNANKWKCDNLSTMLTAFQDHKIDWISPKEATFDEDNIDGIKCYDICKFFYCVDEQDAME